MAIKLFMEVTSAGVKEKMDMVEGNVSELSMMIAHMEVIKLRLLKKLDENKKGCIIEGKGE